jgi:glycosyltransferase involved in cell wall biosynthesis
VSEEQKVRLFEDAVAYLHPQEEDFGITAVESMAAGRPVIAFNKGGATETVIHEKTGLLFNEQTSAAIVDAVQKLQTMNIEPSAIKEHAEQFSVSNFHEQIDHFVQSVWSAKTP